MQPPCLGHRQESVFATFSTDLNCSFMRQLLILLLSFTGLSLSAQTKKIAFESHSGDPNNFHIALTNEFFDNGESDYGLPSHKSKYKLDSVVYLNDSTALLVSKEYQAPWEAKADSLFKFIRVRADTIYNTGLFNKKNTADSIRKGLKSISNMITEYEASSKTKFIGFAKSKPATKEKEKEQPKEQQVLPVIIPNDPPDNSSPFDPGLVWMIVAILLLSLIGGWISWKLYKPQTAVA